MERDLGDVGDMIGKIAIWRAKYSTLPKGEEEIALWLWASSYEYSDGGSGELSGDSLARFNGLVLPRSRGFGDSAWHSNVEMELHRIGLAMSIVFLGARYVDIDR
ncbi:hypothetical protein Acr_12g0000110 [Actinidia rufa]|uniref:Uncharacterized protein n=1 Tax=Actinidia rufa TaxID=165716 RepID=A0A7J0FFJ2_9ERIC|nr:hypothetical protein Acr_12g0000110 [Actinidia rufa]